MVVYWKFLGVGVGGSKAKFFKGKYDARLEFPEGLGWGIKLKVHIETGMDILWNNILIAKW